ncbi:hypothetical protein MMC11_000810 [Xylographa trunciseda]|nr:hypothetical protein [Xylographa trunciseda]
MNKFQMRLLPELGLGKSHEKKAERAALFQEIRKATENYIPPFETHLMRGAVETIAGLPQVKQMVTVLLDEKGAGERYWPSGSISAKGKLRWIQNRKFITKLMRSALAHQIQNTQTDTTGWSVPTTLVPKLSPRRSSRQCYKKDNIVDLEDSELDLDYLNLDSDSDSDSDSQDSEDNSIVETSGSYSTIEQPEYSQSPLEFSSLKVLVNVLQRWQKDNEDDSPPGATRLVTSILSKSITKRATLGDEEVEVARFQIDEWYMGWVLKKMNGIVLYVNVPKTRRPEGAVLHCGWLGGNRGFTDHYIAKSWGPSHRLSGITGMVETLPVDHETETAVHNHPRTSSPTRVLDGADVSFPEPIRQVARNSTSLSPQTHSDERNNIQAETFRSTIKRSRSPSFEIIDVLSKRPKGPRASGTFLFYVSNPTISAILRSIIACSTTNAFCDAAFSALKIMANCKEHDPKIIALQVSWDCLKTALIMPWRDAEAFERIMLAIQKAMMTKNEEMTVDVKCILQT